MTLSVYDAAREAPNDLAVVTRRGSLTFGDLASRVARACQTIEAFDGEASFRRTERIWALAGTCNIDTVIALLAVAETGGTALLLHPRWTGQQTKRWLEHAPDARLLDARLVGRGENSPPSAAWPPSVDDAERALAIVPTSGTAGMPKGIILSRRAFVASAEASAKRLGWQSDDRWLLSLPLAHVGGLSVLTRCLLARKTVVLAEQHQGFRPEALIEDIERFRVTLLSLVPTQLYALLEARPDYGPPPFLRAVLLGGAAASKRLLRQAAERGFPILTTYGLTEACSQVCTQSVGTINCGDLGVGKPLPGTDVRVQGGRIAIRGPTVFSGYYPPTSEAPFDTYGWYETGDHGEWDGAGNLHVFGRGTELIVTGGENVHPTSVEQALEDCPGVQSACAFGVKNEQWGETVAVALVATEAFEMQRLERYCRSTLSTHERPRHVALLPELVTGPTGKLDRKQTAAAARSKLVPLR